MATTTENKWTTKVDNSPEARLARLQASGMNTWAAATNLQKSIGTTLANSNTNLWLTYVNNPDGTPVNAGWSTPAAPTDTNKVVVNPSTWIWTQQTVASWWAQTQADAASDNNIAANTNIASTAIQEAGSQQNLTNELSTIDTSQLNTKVSNAKENQTQAEEIQTQQMIEKTKNEMEYQAEIRKNTDEEVAALKVQQESENTFNAAAAAELKAKNDAAEYELQTQNEIANQQSNIAFAKLWLSFSWAAINTAQSIYTQWVYNLAKLKTTNSKNYADLQVKINSTQFDHIKQVNSIIQEATQKEFDSKERLRDFIWKAQNNILTSKKESQEAIQKAIDDYKTEKQTREDKLYSDMNSANAKLRESTEQIQKTISTNEDNAKKKIDLLISNWQWGSLSKVQQVELESRAWIPAWTTANTIVAKTTTMLMDSIKSIVGKSVAVAPALLAKMHTEVQRALNLNIPLATATQMAIDKYASAIPEISAAKASAKSAAALEASKTTLNLANAEANKLKAEAAMTKAEKTWSGGGSSNVSQQLKDITYEEDVPLTWIELATAQLAQKAADKFKTWVKVPMTKKVTKTWAASYNPKTTELTVDWKKVSWAKFTQKQTDADKLAALFWGWTNPFQNQ